MFLCFLCGLRRVLLLWMMGVVGLLCIVGMFGMQTHHVMWRGLGCKVLLLVSFFYIFD